MVTDLLSTFSGTAVASTVVLLAKWSSDIENVGLADIDGERVNVHGAPTRIESYSARAQSSLATVSRTTLSAALASSRGLRRLCGESAIGRARPPPRRIVDVETASGRSTAQRFSFLDGGMDRS